MLSFLSEIIKIHVVSKLTFKIRNKQNYKKKTREGKNKKKTSKQDSKNTN